MAWVYILQCSDGSYYVGSTTDLARRVWQHEKGEGAAYTRRRRPVRLAWAVEMPRIDEAFAFEKRLQGWGRAKRAALVEGRLDELPLLSGRSTAAVRHRRAVAEVSSPPPGSRDGRRTPSSTSGATSRSPSTTGSTPDGSPPDEPVL
ncbi:MAG TPA: GIY-YIG nuclease family protein [Nocardioides sp.]|jgi:predicted GIY-YIG superfamily endonuclease|nr:GIY-YIG nuclease family protein [Nocardioides sp.]